MVAQEVSPSRGICIGSQTLSHSFIRGSASIFAMSVGPLLGRSLSFARPPPRPREVVAAGRPVGEIAEFITDYELGIDTLELLGFGYASAADLTFTTAGSGDVAIQVTPPSVET